MMPAAQTRLSHVVAANIVCKNLWQELERIAALPKDRVNEIRMDLHHLRRRLPSNRRVLVDQFLAQMNKAVGKDGVRASRLGQHKLTDHAFCRLLERLHGVDLERAKDRAITQAEDAGLRLIVAHGKIVTVV